MGEEGEVGESSAHVFTKESKMEIGGGEEEGGGEGGQKAATTIDMVDPYWLEREEVKKKSKRRRRIQYMEEESRRRSSRLTPYTSDSHSNITIYYIVIPSDHLQWRSGSCVPSRGHESSVTHPPSIRIASGRIQRGVHRETRCLHFSIGDGIESHSGIDALLNGKLAGRGKTIDTTREGHDHLGEESGDR